LEELQEAMSRQLEQLVEENEKMRHELYEREMAAARVRDINSRVLAQADTNLQHSKSPDRNRKYY
jgi:hypothetical protein